jgi:hypothetical protein
MKVEILGTGCYNCIKLENLINQVLKEMGKTGVELVRISDERQIRKFIPLDEIPGLVIDGNLVSTRIVPEKETLASWFSGVDPLAG